MCVHTCVRACVYHSVCVWHATCSMGHMYNIVATFCVHPPSLHPCIQYTSTHTHIHTHTYIATSHLLSLPSVLFSPISPLCPTQGSRLADVMTTSCSSWSTQSTTCRTMFIACAHVSLFSHSIILYLFLYVFVLVDYVFFPIPLTM